MKNKKRLDVLLVEQMYAETRSKAQAIIMAGLVYVNGQKADKAGMSFDADTAVIEVRGQACPYVSRGGLKLEKALRDFGVDPTGFVCSDSGCSTGGFTDCLLQHGASRVYAVDVGHAQLHERLRNDPRVVSREGVNRRTAPPDLITEPIDMIVADLSFISLTMVLPHCLQWLREGGMAVCLIKPQFEVGAGQTVKGVVKDEAVRQEAVDRVLRYMENEGLTCLGVTPAAIKGPKGNQEFLAYWKKGTPSA